MDLFMYLSIFLLTLNKAKFAQVLNSFKFISSQMKKKVENSLNEIV